MSKDYNRRLFVPLQYSNLSSSFVLTSDPPEHVEVEVRGSGFELLGEQWSLDNNPISIDLNAAKSLFSSNRYYIPTIEFRTKLIKRIGANQSLRYIIPDTIYFRTEKRFKKRIPIQADLNLNFESGYNLRTEAILQPDSIEISGPESFIDTVQRIRTVKKEYTALNDTLEDQLELKSFEMEGVDLSNQSVQLFLAVEKFTEKKLSISLEVLNQFDEREIKTFPDEIDAYFLVPLSKYEYLDTTVMLAQCKYSEEEMKKSKLDVSIEGIPIFAKLPSN